MARTQLSPEEQLEDLQRRFQLLEGERKATYAPPARAVWSHFPEAWSKQDTPKSTDPRQN